MDQYITGSAIRAFREKQNMTQAELAASLMISDKTVSKWETGKGYPDITLLEPLAKVLKVSLFELFSGSATENRNRSANLMRAKLYVCPICGNVQFSAGEAVIHCCGLSLPPQEAEPFDEAHSVTLERVEDECFVTVHHPMTKDHYISFLCWVTGDRCEFVKLYPEGNAEARMHLRGAGILYAYCNRHGLLMQRIPRKPAGRYPE